MRFRRLRPSLLALLTLGALAGPAVAFSPTVENENFSKTNERQAEYGTPAYQQDLAERGAENQVEEEQIKLNDPERNRSGNLCANRMNGCAGDVRLYDWQKRGFGIVKPVLWTARNGATISGHVWMTRAGQAHRPGIVITNGSVQAPEQLYWFAAQTLAKRGYIVLTADPQGQGASDTNGEGNDQNEGVPSQAGRPFYDGTEDAIDFFYSSPARKYVPRKSCSTGTSHRAKQDRRVKSHLNAAYNPLYSFFDHKRLGIAGHSFGAAGVSFVGQKDPRVKAIVAWDNLGTPTSAHEFQGQTFDCPSNPSSRTVPPITKPALGMSADYYIPPTPNASDPDPQGKSQGSLAYTAHNVDTGELIIRGGTHYDFSYIPNQAFGASLRGMDLVAWYTGAWFDKYVRGIGGADARLLTSRWRSDATEAGVDPHHDGNLFSFYYRSRLNFHRSNGSHVVCNDVRNGCSALSSKDGFKGRYSYLAAAQTKDHANPKPDRRVILLPSPGRCRTHRSLTFGLRARSAKDPLRVVAVYVNGKLVRKISSRHVPGRVNVRFVPGKRFRVTVSVRTRAHRRYVARGSYHPCG